MAGTDFIIVVEIREGVLDSSHLFNNAAKAEECFKKIVKENRSEVTEDEMDEFLDDGFYELPENNWSVCITHPLQSGKTPAVKKLK